MRSELASPTLAFMLIALACGLFSVLEIAKVEQADAQRWKRVIACVCDGFAESTATHVGVCSQSCVWCDTGPRARTHTHPLLGPDSCAHALWNVCHQFKGVWIFTVDREQVGISVSNATIHPRHCGWHKTTRALQKHEAVCCGLHTSNRVSNAVALTRCQDFSHAGNTRGSGTTGTDFLPCRSDAQCTVGRQLSINTTAGV